MRGQEQISWRSVVERPTVLHRVSIFQFRAVGEFSCALQGRLRAGYGGLEKRRASERKLCDGCSFRSKQVASSPNCGLSGRESTFPLGTLSSLDALVQ